MMQIFQAPPFFLDTFMSIFFFNIKKAKYINLLFNFIKKNLVAPFFLLNYFISHFNFLKIKLNKSYDIFNKVRT